MANNVSTSCAHLEQVNQNIEGKTKGCEECEKRGSDWVHYVFVLPVGMLAVVILL